MRTTQPAVGGTRAAGTRRRVREIPYDLQVVDRSGRAIGELLDVMVDMESGRIAYGVIELKDARTHRARRVAVPWGVLYPDRLEDRLLIAATRTHVERAPALPPASCSRREARRWVKVVDDYFGTLPCWQKGALH
jgi:sporulation protein YlmC with PRC-barrel domain